jgi:hypothetical protein
MKYHLLYGRKVPTTEHDTDHLLRLMLHISKKCNKFALKHNRSDGFADGGVWVARGFVKTKRTRNGSMWELSTIGDTPIVAAEKFLTMLDEHCEREAKP